MNCCHLEGDPGGIVHSIIKISIMSDPKGEYDVVNWNRTRNLVTLLLPACILSTVCSCGPYLSSSTPSPQL